MKYYYEEEEEQCDGHDGNNDGDGGGGDGEYDCEDGNGESDDDDFAHFPDCQMKTAIGVKEKMHLLSEPLAPSGDTDGQQADH